VMAVTRVYSTLVFVIAAGVAILLGLSPKFGALVGSIPAGVLGGVTTVLFGLIAITGARIWVENRVDFSRGVNLFVASVAIIIGAGNYTVHFGNFTFEGITLGTFGAIVLYRILRIADPGADTPAPDRPAPGPAGAEYNLPGTSYPDRRGRSGREGGALRRSRSEAPAAQGELPDLPRRRRPAEDVAHQRNRDAADERPPLRRRRWRSPGEDA
jgi:hypothetical protein